MSTPAPEAAGLLALERLLSIRTDSLIPCQQTTPLGLLRQADCYEVYCFKFPGCAVFHSYAEFIHALLLECDPDVISFVPHPFLLRVNGRLYTPDAYVFSRHGIRVVELKPGAEFDPAWNVSLQAFFSQHEMRFEVISNESVLAQESLALHWLPIVQVLVQAQRRHLNTMEEEQRIFEHCWDYESTTVGDLLNAGLRDHQWREEVALYRLLAQRRLVADLQAAPLDYSTVLQPCS